MSFLREVRGILIGIALAMLAPVIWKRGRPVAKKVLKVGLVLADQAKESAAEAYEQFGDLAAEARAELDVEAAATLAMRKQPEPAAGETRAASMPVWSMSEGMPVRNTEAAME
jgi:hypothetical protein